MHCDLIGNLDFGGIEFLSGRAIKEINYITLTLGRKSKEFALVYIETTFYCPGKSNLLEKIPNKLQIEILLFCLSYFGTSNVDLGVDL